MRSVDRSRRSLLKSLSAAAVAGPVLARFEAAEEAMARELGSVARTPWEPIREEVRAGAAPGPAGSVGLNALRISPNVSTTPANFDVLFRELELALSRGRRH